MIDTTITKVSITMLIILTVVPNAQGGPYCLSSSFLTYNVALNPLIDHFDDRRATTAQAIKNLDADVICLQEVWFASDMINIIDTIGYPYTFSQLHNGVSDVNEAALTNIPCSSPTIPSLLGCVQTACSGTTGIELLVCARDTCNIMEESQQCLTCAILSGGDLTRCLSNPDSINHPGLLLLSKFPLLETTITRFNDTKQFLPRSYISTKVLGVYDTVCTHTTTDLGPVYFEDLPYTSWAAQNLDEMIKLVEHQKLNSYSFGTILMGDLNTGPAITGNNGQAIQAEFEESFDVLVNEGYKSNYISNVRECTLCAENPLGRTGATAIVDHVLTKGLSVFESKRLLDENIQGKDYPLSDHYAVQVDINVAYYFRYICLLFL